MATYLKRLEFKQRFSTIKQGLFIVSIEKRLPKGQEEVNLGKTLSDALCHLPEQKRASALPELIGEAVSRFSSVSLTHLEILFTPGFHLDVVGTLLAMCRNRKICIAWPGSIEDEKLIYATPNSPEYYECNPRPLQDTYIITE